LTPPDGEGDLPAQPPAPPPSAPGQPPAPPSSRPGVGTFTIEGRAAPGLFVVGWLGTLIGGVVLFVSLQTASPVAKLVLFVLGLAGVSLGLIAAAGSQTIERRTRGMRPYWGPSPFLVLAACFPTAAVLLVLLGIPLQLAGIDLDGPLVAVIGLVIQMAVYILLIRLLVVDTGALSWRRMGITPPSSSAIGELLLGAAWALPVFFLTSLLSLVLVSALGVTPDAPLPPAREPAGVVLNLIAGAILAPIGEELFFRAFATTAWVEALGAARGIIRGGLFFAFVHVLQIQATSLTEGLAVALIAFGVRVPIGLVLGWLFVRRGTIWAPIGLHAAFNATILIIAETLSQPPVP
jgi:membrane protease YdiL (CAAX protease family)